MVKLLSLKKSNQFLKILKNKKINTKYFVIFFAKNKINNKKKVNRYLNISFVMKKKIGNAVVRNKIKRKLRSAVHKILKEKHLINLDYTYVIFGKNNVYKDEFKFILDDVNKTFKKINSYK
jgi:ribonuclease P protein component|tara:strand:+ start:108 stop:470 length:363 start_codon:yes stop_codon:yes gene_type:complete